MKKLICILSSLWMAAAAWSAELDLGPMLGHVTDTGATVWFRTDEAADVRVILLAGGEPMHQERTSTKEEDDFTGTVRFEDLYPGFDYRYEVLVDDESRGQWAFSTGSSAQRREGFTFLFTACFKPEFDVRDGVPISRQMAERKANAVLFLGDMPYATNGSLVEVRMGHQAIRRSEGFTELVSAAPVYAVWDDHDFGPNDSDSTHPFVEEALQGFKEYWPNPSYGLPDVPGVFFSFKLGDAEFFMLDDRYHRIQEGPDAAILGEAQTRWLQEGLRSSEARLKFIVSGVQFAMKKKDCWGGKEHRAERDALFSFIEDHGIEGVVLLSGDRHRADVMKIQVSEDRALYEFSSSPMGTYPRDGKKKITDDVELVFSHNDDWNIFSEVEVFPASNEHALALRIFSGTKGQVYERMFSPEELGIKHSSPSSPASGEAR